VIVDLAHAVAASPTAGATGTLLSGSSPAAGRDLHLHLFLQRCREAFQAASARPAAADDVAARIFAALATAGDASGAPAPARVPACAHLPAALATASAGPGAIPALADALQALSPRLAWYRRAGSQLLPGPFHDGHASAIVKGPGGLEQRDDVKVGLSLMAPQVRYPDHQHPPEEIYVVLTPGQWRQRDGRWHEPGAGGIVHNPPGIVHAMRSGKSPLLAVWFLWLGP